MPIDLSNKTWTEAKAYIDSLTVSSIIIQCGNMPADDFASVIYHLPEKINDVCFEDAGNINPFNLGKALSRLPQTVTVIQLKNFWQPSVEGLQCIFINIPQHVKYLLFEEFSTDFLQHFKDAAYCLTPDPNRDPNRDPALQIFFQKIDPDHWNEQDVNDFRSALPQGVVVYFGQHKSQYIAAPSPTPELVHKIRNFRHQLLGPSPYTPRNATRGSAPPSSPFPLSRLEEKYDDDDDDEKNPDGNSTPSPLQCAHTPPSSPPSPQLYVTNLIDTPTTSYGFIFRLLQGLAALSTIGLALGIAAIYWIDPISLGVQITAACGVGLAVALFGLFSGSESPDDGFYSNNTL